MIGTLLKGRYRIDTVLGEGGMGVVYKAHDGLLQRPVAIKTLTPALLGDEGARRLLREAQSAAKLTHPHIVSTFDAVEESGSFAIVMELVEGKTLRELLPVSPDRLVEIAVQILAGLDYAHAHGIVHRDIKPENIVITADGVAKLMDFGLARSEGRSRLTHTGLIVGTVTYLAPEQALGGHVDGRSDLYSLGAVLYEAVARRPPFESDDPISVISQHINVPPVAPHWHNPSVPQGLENVILRLLAKDPARRYQTAREVLDALASVRSTVAGSAPQAAPAGAERLAGPALVERMARSPLVGRDAELARLRELLDQTLAGRGAVVLVTGPLGVGKTRLVEEAVTYAHLRGIAVVAGKAYESAPPYEPLARALRDLARGVDSETLAARLGEFAPELIGLIPELTRQLPRGAERTAGAPEDRKNRLFAGVAHLLGATAAQTPLLLFLDDAHLADPATLELLQHVARRSEASRVLLVVAYRPEDIPSSPAGRLFGQITHDLGREPFCTRIALHPLSEEQVVDLITSLAGLPKRPVHFGRRLYEVTEGNAYFIEEVIKGLFEQGALYIKDGQWSTDFDEVKDYSLLQIPTSVRDAVEARLRSLGDQSRQVLTQAAVIGQRFSFDTLLALTGADEASLLDRVEEALRARLIREVRGAGEDVYEFAQPMLRQVLYDAIPRRRRRLIHRKVGETLETLPGPKQDAYLEALAHHFTEAEETEKALKYARLAARKAAAVFAYDDATRYLQQAIAAAEELDRSQERFEAMEELGDLLFAAGRREQTVRALEDALQFWKSLPGTSNVDGARLCRKLGEIGSRWAAYNPRTREHIIEGLRLLEDSPAHPERVRLIVAKAHDLHWLRPAAEADYPAAEASAREGYRLAESIGTLREMSSALDALAGLYLTTADFSKMLETTTQRVPIVERLDDPRERNDLHHMLAFAYDLLGDFAQAVKHAEHGYEVASQSGMFGPMVQNCGDAVRAYTWWDRWADAERWCRLYEQAEDRVGARVGHREWIIVSRVMTAAARGNVDGARRLEDELQTVPVRHPALAWNHTLIKLLAALALNDVEKARSLLEEGLRLADTPVAALQIQTQALQFACQAREWDDIDRLGDDTLARARSSGGRRHVALNCRALGIYRREHGRLGEADPYLQEAVDLFRALDCRYELGKTLRELALLRRAQGRGDDAARLLQEALTLFAALGALPDAESTRALM